MRYFICILWLSYLLSACSLMQAPQPVSITCDAAVTAATAPLQQQIKQLQSQITQLNNHNYYLRTHVATTFSFPPYQALSTFCPAACFDQDNNELDHGIIDSQTDHPSNLGEAIQAPYLQQLQQLFLQKKYASVIHQGERFLKRNSSKAQHAQVLWWLLQSHHKLNHCESVIITARRLARRYADFIHTPDGLLLMAQCQFLMQQKDIAKETLNWLISRYPDTSAATTAADLLKNPPAILPFYRK